LFRATACLALALGLAYGTSATAAPPATGSIRLAQAKPPENPFDDRGGSDDDKGDKAPGEGDEVKTPPAPPAKAPEAEDKSEASGDENDEGEAEGEEAPQDNLHALTCLEGDATGGRRKGVQRRDFLKKHRFELSGVGGFYASDALSSTYSYGGALAFYPSEDFGVEVLVTRSPVQFRLEQPFTAFDKEEHFVPGVAWQGIFSLLWSPIHAKFKFSEQTIIHGDVFAVAGAGRTFHESVLGLTWEAGGGFKLYFSRFVAFRLDVRDFLLPQEVLGRGRITNNVTVLGGFGVWFG
jgi:outer membrane beta-barrel protein